MRRHESQGPRQIDPRPLRRTRADVRVRLHVEVRGYGTPTTNDYNVSRTYILLITVLSPAGPGCQLYICRRARPALDTGSIAACLELGEREGLRGSRANVREPRPRRVDGGRVERTSRKACRRGMGPSSAPNPGRSTAAASVNPSSSSVPRLHQLPQSSARPRPHASQRARPSDRGHEHDRPSHASVTHPAQGELSPDIQRVRQLPGSWPPHAPSLRTVLRRVGGRGRRCVRARRRFSLAPSPERPAVSLESAASSRCTAPPGCESCD